MTIEEKRQAMRKICHQNAECKQCRLSEIKYKKDIRCGQGFSWDDLPEKQVEMAYDYLFGGKEKVELKAETTTCGIKDSGERRAFETGAVRDIQEGKGRCDLLPLQEVSLFFDRKPEIFNILFFIGEYQKKNDVLYLFKAIQEFIKIHYVSIPTCFLELSKHFEEGAKKYGENNWQKGIPTHCYIDSAVRHFFKFFRGDNDEPHDRAFVWNLICCIWTCKNKPEMNDYALKTNDFDTKTTESDSKC